MSCVLNALQWRVIHQMTASIVVVVCVVCLGENRWVCKTVLEGAHRRTIRCVSWSPCGRLLAASSFDGTTSIWSSRSSSSEFECIAMLEGHENEVKCVAWSSSGAYIATCSRDKSVWIFEGEVFSAPSCLSAMLLGRGTFMKMIIGI